MKLTFKIRKRRRKRLGSKLSDAVNSSRTP